MFHDQKKKKGKFANVDIPAQQSINQSILGCMLYYGLAALSQQVSKTRGLEKRKLVSRRSGLPHGTYSRHFLLFVSEMLSALKNLKLNNFYFVMDNVAIDKAAEFLQANP